MNVGASTTYTITLTKNGPTVVPAGVIAGTIPVNTVGSETEVDCAITAGPSDDDDAAARGGRGEHLSTDLILSAGVAPPRWRTPPRSDDPGDVRRSVAANKTATDGHGPAGEPSITKTDSTHPENPGASFNYV